MATTEAGLADTKLLTADDLLRLSGQGVRGELVRGVLHETMASGHRHGKIAVNVVMELGNFVRPRKLGSLVASDSGVWLERDPDTVREPDVAFTSAEKIPLDAEIDGYAEVVPDLVVEIVSPSDSRRWARDRAQMWLGHGAPLVWIVHPDTRTIDVYRPGADSTTLQEDDSLEGHDVLPGFTCSVSTIFD
ncbi:Uma2 family endonuclease [Candidatus Poriferisocius sp.]|uniref:Uma2 family endonuclease n=1 Tax=Candidatus Poriferisocius sp. TaxID=3101276 RepID=UPI003B01BF4B